MSGEVGGGGAKSIPVGSVRIKPQSQNVGNFWFLSSFMSVTCLRAGVCHLLHKLLIIKVKNRSNERKILSLSSTITSQGRALTARDDRHFLFRD